MNDVKFYVECKNDEQIVYKATTADTGSMDALLVIQDEDFTPETTLVLKAYVDNNVVYESPVTNVNEVNNVFDAAELAVEKAIA
jgi:hypothetical protein